MLLMSGFPCFRYEEYVQEYREKYDSYCSINKILESYRFVARTEKYADFSKFHGDYFL